MSSLTQNTPNDCSRESLKKEEESTVDGINESIYVEQGFRKNSQEFARIRKEGFADFCVFVHGKSVLTRTRPESSILSDRPFLAMMSVQDLESSGFPYVT